MGASPATRATPFKVATGSRADLAQTAAAQLSRYPRDWVTVAQEQTKTIRYTKEQRGYFQKDGVMRGGHKVVVSGYNPSTVMLHELGHLMEWTNPHIKALEAAFYRRRVYGEKLRRYSRSTDVREVVRPDEFANEYVGKDYRPGAAADFQHSPDATAEIMPGPNEFYEVLTMGMQGVFDGESDLWAKDPDMTNFILGLLVAA